jgi:hypothetical protein
MYSDLKQSGGLAQLARAPALQAGGHRFDSDILHRRLKLECLKDGRFFKGIEKIETKTIAAGMLSC